jgi:tetratricopeptide (TPR) repeat protein
VKVNINQVRFLLIVVLSLNQSVALGHSKSLLLLGDRAVLDPPEADFFSELERIKLPPPEFRASQTSVPYLTEDTNIPELNDLREALQKSGKSAPEIEEIVLQLYTERRKVQSFEVTYEKWKFSDAKEPEPGAKDVTRKPQPAFPQINPVKELPDEFADYLCATVAWRNPYIKDKGVAREAWLRILSAPREKRHFRCTWAAYMLGKSWEKESPEKAIEYYEKVRTLARVGFADSLGLAAASFGWEARIYLNQTNYERAAELYLEQLATGDNSARGSLLVVMESLALTSTNLFHVLARHPKLSRVMTGHFISAEGELSSGRLSGIVNAWLTASKDAFRTDPNTSEELALAAYKNGDWESAQYWIDHAGSSPTAQWLEAKLFLRSGKTNEALTSLEKAQRLFSTESRETNAVVELKDILSTYGMPATNRIRGELGVLYLARGNYSESLDWFMRGGLWIDAAYVAERMLTIDELKAYVDRYWPAGKRQMKAESEDTITEKDVSGELRYLLARRLTRELRGNEAREYYPVAWRARFDALADVLVRGWNESLPAEQRATALLTAGWITRTNGMELIGTELSPDCHIYDGDFETSLTVNSRANKDFTLFPASSDEKRRYAEHNADPEVRFHYRYQAAFLGWEAARLLPNNSEETARTLSIAGSWIKALDPETANLFYKSLVRRCRKTPIGSEADRIRWFPRFNENGQVIPRISRLESMQLPAERINPPQNDTKTGEPVPEYPTPGIEFILRSGDTLQNIAEAASALGQPLTAKQILDANPGLDAARLRVGQRIFIPLR